jgi:hypothetical protein
MSIFKKTGKVIACYERITDPLANTQRVPARLYTENNDPAFDINNYKKYYIFAKFEQSEPETAVGIEGRTSTMYGNITIPYLWRDILNKTEFFDPFLNGSRFIKTGAAVDDESLFIVQSVQAVYLPQLGDIG